jgi:DNA-binding PadR family transcriptional regulator
VSSIRLFILGSLAERGPMHGHALRVLAEEEHIDQWADVSPGAIYGAFKRLAVEVLIEPLRVEREGNYPERQVYAITAAGAESLALIRREALETIVYRHDPVDLALARLDDASVDELESTLRRRLAQLTKDLENGLVRMEYIAKYLTVIEKKVLRHQVHKLMAEIAWHEELLGALPEIITDEKSRKGRPA